MYYIMYCIYENNICFWWNPKCGCSFIKKLFKYLLNQEIKYTDAIDWRLHENTRNLYRPIMKDYTHVLFIRNPYHRLVSGFIQIYIKEWGPLHIRLAPGIYEHRLQQLTFNQFVNTVLKNKKSLQEKWYINDHFLPQTTNYNNRFVFTKIFDLYNIDYNYLSNLFEKEIIEEDINKLRNTGKNHVNIQTDYNKPVYNYTIDTFKDMKIIPKYKYFYNNNLKRKVYEIYKEDFYFLERHGFKFDV